MRILVCISHVPDTTTKIVFEGDGKNLNKTGVTYIINPYCEYGLSKAVGLREDGQAIESITALTVGGPEVEPTLRRALAIGADDAVRLVGDPQDPYVVATQIADYARDKGYDIIFTGKESIDFNGGLVPGIIAEQLKFAFVPYATKMDLIDAKTAEVQREVDGGIEIMEVTFPAVISCQKGIAEWRIPNMRGIMASRKKPLIDVAPSPVPETLATVGFSYPPAKGNCTYYAPEEADKLIDSLINKGLI